VNPEFSRKIELFPTQYLLRLIIHNFITDTFLQYNLYIHLLQSINSIQNFESKDSSSSTSNDVQSFFSTIPQSNSIISLSIKSEFPLQVHRPWIYICCKAWGYLSLKVIYSYHHINVVWNRVPAERETPVTGLQWISSSPTYQNNCVGKPITFST